MPEITSDDAEKDIKRPDIEILITDDAISITFVKDISLSELVDLLSQSGVFRH